ncbi:MULTISPECIES: DnaA N-terminal domain-containing protein [Bacillus]|uniref:DnaA N-terminal domain-containing protein n=1 Tax=Bacillus TaxID=1386 RepID=UPI0002DF5085|nr:MULTISPECIES: DnaA N-terminal domain-containing protein [Bacillus]
MITNEEIRSLLKNKELLELYIQQKEVNTLIKLLITNLDPALPNIQNVSSAFENNQPSSLSDLLKILLPSEDIHFYNKKNKENRIHKFRKLPIKEYDVHELWSHILLDLSKIVKKPSFETWLLSANAEAISKTTLTVSAPNEFARDWLENRYRTLIVSSLQELTGQSFTISFIVKQKELT